jgi:hypothetical protein
VVARTLHRLLGVQRAPPSYVAAVFRCIELTTCTYSPDAVTTDQVRPVTGGGHGEGGSAFSYVLGRSGGGVPSIGLAVNGKTVEAHVDNGWWTAWWPDAGTTPGRSASPMTITATLRNGRSWSTPLTYE